ncbi:MAG: 2-oxoglutarate dehydrogenase E1 component, partial [Porticoccaceae bacterium]|nr:2-oxoglutarate dehydrogenase E1 component [Porticoccaceae bacterium]
CGLSMMFPHGFEGQGPEHSSARLERFLQLCAEHNMQICNPTTPAQIFHLLRRQAIRPMRRPLVIMSPKWILRHKLATSSLEDLSEGEFNNVIDDASVDPALAKRVILCSGKVYYHLLEERDSRGITDIAIIRLEQLYPFPDTELDAILDSYNNLQSAVWCQEEPMNQGAWYSSQHHMRSAFNRIDPKLYLTYAGRPGSAAPASGYMSVHLDEQKKFIDEALTFNN